MDPTPYPVDLRADYPERSSRGWAALTILFLIKLLALLPHGIVLIFLGIAQWVVAFVAQFVVVFKGEYPASMHGFVTGVLRWSTRVTAFVLSLNDRYPPFTLQSVDDYPLDVVVQRPERPSRVYAAFTIVVQILALVFLGWLVIRLAQNTDASSWSSQDNSNTWSSLSSGNGGLLLRQLAALPHYFVLFFVGIVVWILWLIVQWVILFVARYPQGLWDLTAGWLRWYTRVGAYALGLVDRYPPFSFDPSLTAQAPPAPPAAGWPAAPAGAQPAPPPSPPPTSSSAAPTTVPPMPSEGAPDASVVPPAPDAPPSPPAPEEPRQP